MHWCGSAAPGLGTPGLNNRRLFLHCSGGRKSGIEVLAGLGFPGAWLCGLQVLFPLCNLPVIILLCVCILAPSSHRDTSYLRLEPTLRTSFYLNHHFQGPGSEYSHILWYWGVGLHNRNLMGTQVSPNTSQGVPTPMWEESPLRSGGGGCPCPPHFHQIHTVKRPSGDAGLDVLGEMGN